MPGNSMVLALPDMRHASVELRRRLRREGIEIATAPFGGVRTQADTTLILQYRDNDWARLSASERAKYSNDKNRWRPIAAFGNSHHNYGAAEDFQITKYPNTMTYTQAYNRVILHAREIGLRAAFIANDPNHLQLNVTLEQARVMYTQHQKQLREAWQWLAVAAAAAFALLLVRG